MFNTEDNYNLYFDGRISQDQVASFEILLDRHKLDRELVNLFKTHHNFRINNSYTLHKSLLWVLFETLGPYAITIFFAEVEHPHGCEHQSRVDFYVDVNGNFDYELKNKLFLYPGYESSEECMEKIKQESVGFDNDRRTKGNIKGVDLEAFLKSITAEE